MGDLIYREEAVKVLISNIGDAAEAFIRLEKLPAVDAACVVRCKDCKNWDEDSGVCYENSSRLYCFLSEEDFYCKAGCKKDGNDFDVG